MISIVANFSMYSVFSSIMAMHDRSLHDDEVKDHVVHFIPGGLRDRLAQPA